MARLIGLAVFVLVTCVVVADGASAASVRPTPVSWTSWIQLDEAHHPVLQSVERLMAANSNVSVELLTYQVSPLMTFLHWLEGLSGPDICPPQSLVPIADRMVELFHDLTAVVDEEFGDDLLPLARARRVADGSAREVPLFADVSSCFYSRSYFDALGITPPTTWDELMAVCARITDDGKACLTEGIPIVKPTGYFDALAVRMYGAEFYSQLALGNVSLVDDPRVADVFAVLASAVAYFPTTTAPVAHPLFDVGQQGARLFDSLDLGNGLAAIACDYSVLTDIVADFTPTVDADIGAFPFPAYTGPRAAGAGPPADERAEIGFVASYSIPRNALHPDAAKTVLRHVASEAEQATMAPLFTSMFPVRPSLNGTVTTPRRRLLYDLIAGASVVFERSFGLTGHASVAEPWGALHRRFLQAPNADAALALLDAELPALDAARIFVTSTRTLEPEFTPPGGSFSAPVSVVLTSRTPSSIIFYTLDGSVPTTASAVYTAPIKLAASGAATIRAIALAEGLVSSHPSRSEYILALAVAPSPASSTSLVLAIVLPLVGVCCCLAAAIGFVVYRRKSVTFRIASDRELVIPAEDIDVGRAVGVGSFGTVYAGTWRGTPVAVKRMHSADLSPNELREFASEASLLLRLRHPNVLMFMGVTLEPLGIVTEYMTRGSLYDVLHDADIFIHPSMTYMWAHSMASGLAFLASAGIVHGDFKSLNVLFDTNWTAKICDFGLSSVRPLPGAEPAKPSRRAPSRVAPAPDLEAAAPPADVGTLFWAAPEILSGASATTSASDAYALGITLWELATRADVYAGANPIAVTMDVISGRRPDEAAIPHTAAALTPVIRDLWAANPAARPSLADVVRLLEPNFSETAVVFPAAKSEPCGTVYLAHIVAAGFGDRIGGPDVATEEAALLAFDHAIGQLAKATSSAVVDRGLGRFTLAFHTPAIAAVFVAELLESEWASRVAALLLHGDITTETDAHGIRRLAGPIIDTLASTWSFIFGSHATAEAAIPFDRAAAPVLPAHATVGIFTTSDVTADMAGKNATVGLFPLAARPDLIRLGLLARSPTSERLVPSAVASSDIPPAAASSDAGDAASSPGAFAQSPAASSSSQAAAPRRWLLSRFELAALVERAQAPAIMGSYSRVYDSQLGATPVIIKVLLRQQYDVAALAALARAVAASAAAAAAVPRGGAIGPIALCVDRPFVAVVVPRLEHGSLADILDPIVEPESSYSSGHARTTRQPDSGLVLTPTAAAVVMRDVVAHLAAIHDATGHGHGSLKPANILLRGAGANIAGAVVTDIALDAIKANQGTMTMVPTVAYLSPEALRGNEMSTHGDVFVVGTLLYEMATRKHAFSGSNALEVGSQILAGNRPQLDSITNPVVALVVSKCWGNDPDLRPTMRQIEERLVDVTRVE